jgi:hypothetical protein
MDLFHIFFASGIGLMLPMCEHVHQRYLLARLHAYVHGIYTLDTTSIADTAINTYMVSIHMHKYSLKSCCALLFKETFCVAC